MLSLPAKDRDDRTSGAWRREGPLPPLDSGRGGSRFGGGVDRAPVDDSDWTMARGAKFTPTADEPRAGSGAGGRKEFASGFGRPSGGFESGNFERGSRFQPSAPPPPASDAPPKRFNPAAPAGEAEIASTWRRAAPLPSSNATSPDSSTATSPNPAASMQRKKLELQPRSTSSGSVAAPEPSPATSNKPNPFGAAAPVDTAAKERAIAEKQEQLRQQAKDDRIAAAEAKKTAAAEGRNGATSPPSEGGGSWRRGPARSTESVSPSLGASTGPKSPPLGVNAQPKSRQASGSQPSSQQAEKALKRDGFSFASAAAAKALAETEAQQE